MQSFAHLTLWTCSEHSFVRQGMPLSGLGAVAAIFFQYPIGWLADKFNRHWLLILCVLILMLCILLFPLLITSGREAWWQPQTLALWTVVSIWGGAMGGIFTVGITLLGQRFRGVELVSANAVFSVLFGIGGLLGPFLAGTAMTAIGPAGFPLSLLGAVVLYALFAIYRSLPAINMIRSVTHFLAISLVPKLKTLPLSFFFTLSVMRPKDRLLLGFCRIALQGLTPYLEQGVYRDPVFERSWPCSL